MNDDSSERLEPTNVHVPQDRLVDFCRRHHIRQLASSGSVLREDFGPKWSSTFW